MAVGHQLPVAREILEGLLLELRAVAIDVVEYLRLADEERAVDPSFAGLRLLVEDRDGVAVHLQVAEAGRRAHRGQGDELAVGLVEIEQRAEVHVRNAVAPGEEEALLPDHVLQALDAAARVRLQPGVDQLQRPAVHRPGVGVGAGVELDVAARVVDAEVAGRERGEVRRVSTDVLALVAERDGEILVAKMRVVAHYMP